MTTDGPTGRREHEAQKPRRQLKLFDEPASAAKLAAGLKRRGRRIGLGTNPPAWLSFIPPLPEEWSAFVAENPEVCE